MGQNCCGTDDHDYKINIMSREVSLLDSNRLTPTKQRSPMRRELQMTNIKKFLKKYSVKELHFFNGHSNLTESYLCERKGSEETSSSPLKRGITTVANNENKRIIVALKATQNDLAKVQEKVDKLCNLNDNQMSF